MRELSLVELEVVSGAGWLQDSLASFGSKIGAALWTSGSNLLSVDVPLVGTVSLATLAPDMGKNIGQSLGSSLGGAIESKLAQLPVVGDMLNKWLGN